MINWKELGIMPTELLLPHRGVDLEKWAVVACDQFTSQPEYWRAVADAVGDAPSTLRLVLPEAFLGDAPARTPGIWRDMAAYVPLLTPAVNRGFLLTRRETAAGARLGLVAAMDLEQYDYAPGTAPLIRATEGTIAARIPPRAAIRKEAPLETSHVLVLLDDPACTVIEPLYQRRAALPLCYDTPLMLGGGRLAGWAVEEDAAEPLAQALQALKASSPFLYAVGDGNHSLATAKAHWEALKPALAPGERATHPARYAMVELENLHQPALTFQPIHRLLTGVDGAELLADWAAYCLAQGWTLTEGETFTLVMEGQAVGLAVEGAEGELPVGLLQRFLDGWLAAHPQAGIDYIHGAQELRQLAQNEGSAGILLPALEKSALFPAVDRDGALPRKTFSMGEAREKRYYMECRRIR